MNILLVDNYDSFTYNLVHYFESLNAKVTVVYNDQINFDSVINYDKIVLSPGPGLPEEAGQLNKIIADFSDSKPILGVCLGFQALAIHFGGKLYNQSEVKHGVKKKCIANTETTLFKRTANSFNVGLYHSWAVEKETLPEHLRITAISEEDVIMAFEHEHLPVFGVQFHPESILSEHGLRILQNFIEV